MAFAPPRCPYDDCPSRPDNDSFRYRKKGFYDRTCDGRRVQRFQCHECTRSFSSQSFRVDFGYRKPHLDVRICQSFVSKVTMRKTARTLGVRRETVERRMIRYGIHAQQLSEWLLAQERAREIPHEAFSMDELESFETDRKLEPVTVPILIERESRYVVHAEVETLPARKPLSKKDTARLEALEKKRGVRQSGSLQAVRATLEQLLKLVPQGRLTVVTDMKTTYRSVLAELFGKRVDHVQVSSKRVRNEQNPLFPINHTLAVVRDSVAKLVRRNWAHAKRRERLALHVWIWIAFRNLVRPRFVTARRIEKTPAQRLGLTGARWDVARLIRWRVWGLPQ